MREIVVARIGTYVTNNPLTIQTALVEGHGVEFFDREFAKRMASIFPERWTQIAHGGVLFLMDENGEVADAS